MRQTTVDLGQILNVVSIYIYIFCVLTTYYHHTLLVACKDCVKLRKLQKPIRELRPDRWSTIIKYECLLFLRWQITETIT